MQDDIKSGAKDFSQAAKNELNGQKNKFNEFGKMASDKASEYSDLAMDKSKEYYGVSKNFVEKNPVLSVAIATGIGVFVGSVIAGAISSKKD